MNIGFDLLFLATIGATSVAFFIFGEEKAQRLMIGSIMGILAATQLEEPISKLLKFQILGDKQYIIYIILLFVPIIFCLIAKNVRDAKFPKSKLKALVAGFISAFVMMGYAIAGLNEALRKSLITEHNLAALAYNLKFITLGILIAYLLFVYLSVGKAKR